MRGARVLELGLELEDRCTPARLTPSLVSSWIRRSSAMSRSE